MTEELRREETVIPPQSEFVRKLEKQWEESDTLLCVGLDPDYSKIPQNLKDAHSIEETLYLFNVRNINATFDLVCAYKPNSAFYERYGEQGLRALRRTVGYIKDAAPEIPIILDAKRGDIGNTNLGYVEAAFDTIGVDAITVSPYLGKEALKPFLARKDKGIIVLAKTSNPGAGEFQDLVVKHPVLGEVPLYQAVAYSVAHEWNTNGNCLLVAGATYPPDVAKLRSLVGRMPFLVPGVGTQGAKVEEIVPAGKDDRGLGMIINSSSGIIHASSGDDSADAARKKAIELRAEINKYR